MVSTSRTPRVALGLSLALLPALALGHAAPAAAGCTLCTPAVPTPEALWGNLEPLDPLGVPLPAQRDSTLYTGQAGQFPDSHLPLFTSITTVGGYAFVAYTGGFEIWSLSNSPAITRQSVTDGWRGDFLAWPNISESRWLIWDIATPPGNRDVVVTAGYVGISVWDTRNKAAPRQAYQDGMDGVFMIKQGQSVWVGHIGGRDYAFLAVPQTDPSGLFMYDVTQALTFLPNGCAEDTTVQIGCPGVYKGKLGTDGAFWVDGITTAAGRTFVAYGTGLASGDVQIWDVTTPTAPQFVVRFLGSGAHPNAAAFWHDSARDKDYLGVRTTFKALIEDVTPCLDGDGCSSTEIQQTWQATLAAPIATDFVTFSRSGTAPYLYFGTDDKHSAGLQREFLYNVSDPAAPVEVSPKGTINVGGSLVDYWGYYYEGNASGYNQVMPRVAVFDGTNLYRTAWTLFDIHSFAEADPNLLFADGFESGDTGAWSDASSP
jgi:hypothetical protein